MMTSLSHASLELDSPSSRGLETILTKSCATAHRTRQEPVSLWESDVSGCFTGAFSAFCALDRIFIEASLHLTMDVAAECNGSWKEALEPTSIGEEWKLLSGQRPSLTSNTALQCHRRRKARQRGLRWEQRASSKPADKGWGRIAYNDLPRRRAAGSLSKLQNRSYPGQPRTKAKGDSPMRDFRTPHPVARSEMLLTSIVTLQPERQRVFISVTRTRSVTCRSKTGAHVKLHSRI